MSRAISEALDLEPYTPPVAQFEPVPETAEVKEDADYARKNLRELIETSKEALKEALVVAINSESPRAYEVIANLIGTSSDLNTKLLDAHATERKIESSGPKGSPTTAIQNNTTNNIVFRGTPQELAKLLKDGS